LRSAGFQPASAAARRSSHASADRLLLKVARGFGAQAARQPPQAGR